jgi:predicted nucleic acid-binding protein
LSYLLDTNVISELTKRRPNEAVIAWFGRVAGADLHLSVITLGEIRKGIELRRQRDPAGAEPLEHWFDMLRLRYRSRILSFDEEAAEVWGRIMAAHPRVPIEDGQLAATALSRDLTLVTRNLRDVAETGVACVDPFAD